MCGIFGVVVKEDLIDKDFLIPLIKSLFKLSESRGKEAAGLAFFSGKEEIKVIKQALPASRFLKEGNCQNALQNFSSKELKEGNFVRALIGHTRLATNGALELNINNQPVAKDRIVLVHNGIVVNDQTLWQKFPLSDRLYEVDTELIASLTRYFLGQGQEIKQAIANVFGEIEGGNSIAVFAEDQPYLVLATNTGSLYFLQDTGKKIIVFASEKRILQMLIKKNLLSGLAAHKSIIQVNSKNGYLISFSDLAMERFELLNAKPNLFQPALTKSDSETLVLPEKVLASIGNLKRCTKCILPATMPFIDFDEQGVCNYCRNYQKLELKGEAALKNFVEPFRKVKNEPDCLVAFSGGRDSSFALHYIKNVLKMNPVAFSYDWGMLTDLGRRNQSRMCGALGVEHILVSADIKRKRGNIRKNVSAWLKKPALGTVPLFMAGDKQYFYYANKIARQMDIKLIALGFNLMERTDFKTGFSGVNTSLIKSSHYRLGFLKALQMGFYYAKQCVLNPAYLNSSLTDTFSAYLSYYFISHNYFNLYSFIKWDEKNIVSTLVNDYNWETAVDTDSTWRIGDGTAAFYNYIYYLAAGFTENDTFRSNQIREGLISREDALIMVRKDNEPRLDSLKWYCRTIGIDLAKALQIINKMSKLYPLI